MALSTSFTGGWFFLGQFFDHAVAGFLGTREIAKNYRQRTPQDIVRGRGRFQVFVKAEDVIASLAKKLVKEDDDSRMMAALRDALDAHYIDWDPEYFDQLLDERDGLPARKAWLDAKERASVEDWFKRRQSAMRKAL